MKTYQGSCHCGYIKFSVRMNLDHVRVCNCSICIKRGALNHRVPKADLEILTPLNKLSLYEWGTKTAKDYFCPKCGILPFRKPRNLTEQEIIEGVQPFDGWAINVRCLEAVDIESLPVKHINGKAL